MKTVFFLAFVLAGFAFTTPSDSSTNTSVASGGEIINMRVQTHKSDCRMFGGLSTCGIIQIGSAVGSNEWQLLDRPIEGFNNEAGYLYNLKVRVDDSKYRLISVVSKKRSL